MNSSSDDDIVISGIAGRFPKSKNIEEFSTNLFNKVDMTDEFKFVSDKNLPARSGKLLDTEKFDANFFSIMHKLADAMDPQMRALLEHSYECVLDAGISPQSLIGSNTGVIIGCSNSDSKMAAINESSIFKDGYIVLGKSKFFLPNRISYSLGLRGPSFMIDTACSSTASALDIAYRYISSGLCDAVLVGGCQMSLSYLSFVEFSSLGLLATDGISRPFDEKASGFVRSAAVGTLLLQRRKDAKRVYATVVNSMANNDGFKCEGLTLPSMEVQIDLMEKFYKTIDINPCEVKFIEAHATSTFLGDYQEVCAIDKVFCKNKNRTEKLTIGGVKSNMGHAEAASGLASITKIITAFETQKFPPNRNLIKLRKDIPAFSENRIKVATDEVELNSEYIAMNSFGLGGSNVHVLFKQNPKEKVNFGIPSDSLERIVFWSGRTEDAINSIYDDIEKRPLDAEHIALLQNSQILTPDANTYRSYGIFKNDEKAKCIKRDIQGFDGTRRPIVFVYSGMGTQWHEMGRDLMNIPLFADTIEKCHEILLNKHVDLKGILNSSDVDIYSNIMNAYLGIISIEIALTDVLKSLDVKPDYIIGHSVGEIACSYADECFTIEEALTVAFTRAKITIETNISEGAMAAIGMHFSDVEKILPVGIDIACHNSAQSTTISGLKDDVGKLIEHCKSQMILAKEVACADIPFHSRYIKGVGEKLHDELLKILTQPKSRSSRWITSTYAQDNEESALCDAKYHANNLLKPVLFEEAIKRLPTNAITIEISPHGFLNSILKSSLEESKYIDLAKRSTQDNRIDGKIYLFESLGRFFQCGIDMNISALYPPIQFPVSRSTPMISPQIKWNHSENYHIESQSLKHNYEYKKVLINVNEKKFEFLKDHIVNQKAIVPGSFWLVTVWKILGIIIEIPHDQFKVTFENIEFLQAVPVLPNKDIVVTVHLSSISGCFEVFDNDSVIVKGSIRKDESFKITQLNIPENRDAVTLNSEDFYKITLLQGFNYLESFKTIKEIRSDGACGKMKIADNWTIAIDTCFQLSVLYCSEFGSNNVLLLPKEIKRLSVDPILHTQIKNDKLKKYETDDIALDFKSSFTLNLLNCCGIEVEGYNPAPVKRSTENKPIFESYKFIPLHPVENSEVFHENDAWNVMLQSFTERSTKNHFSIIEIYDDRNLASEILSKLIQQVPFDFNLKLITSNSIKIDNVEVLSDKKITSFDNVDVIIKNNAVNDEAFVTSIKSTLNESGVLITQMNSNVKINHDKFEIISKMTLINGNVLMMLKFCTTHEKINYKIIEVSTNFKDWLESLKNAVETEDSILIYSQRAKDFTGILGFFKCLRMETPKSLKCFLIYDKKAPKFNINDPFYKSQLVKGYTINVFKNGQWGNYYHLEIDFEDKIAPQSGHCFVNYLSRGDLSSIKWLEGPISIQDKNSNDIIRIQYSALNFKDVVHALGFIADNLTLQKQCAIGLEFSGIRRDTGERVMGICNNIASGLATYFPLKHAILFKVPHSITLEEAATIPVVYMTVYYAFFISTQIKVGKSILIHSGTGGVGQAALHVAFAYGLEVFTTVGTKQKRKFLLETFPQLKAENIGNSRDMSFKQMIMENTNNRGVNYVLNSLSGDKLKASMECLGKNGVFLEIGRVDVEQGSPISMEFLLKNIAIKLIKIDEIDQADETDREHLMKTFNRDLNSGIIKPINRTVFDASEVQKALRFMTTGNHIGKVLLKVRENENDVESVPLNVLSRFYCNENHSYVVLGGLGGIGIEFCQWLVSKECRKLVISSSRGISNQYQAFKINFLKSFGAEILIATNDITTKSGCEKLLLKASELGPIGGIFNLAAVLQDAIFANQTENMFKKSFASKAVATKYFHELSLKYCPDLKYFVVFSSIASGRGIAGQTNYGMANSIMEEIIEMRHEMGLSAKAIQLGPVKDVGLLSKIQSNTFGEYLMMSLKLISDSLDVLLTNPHPIVACTGQMQKTSKKLESKSFIGILMNLLNIVDRKAIPMNSTLLNLGIDSLTGVELQYIIQRDYHVSIKPNEMKSMTIIEMKVKLESHSDNERIHNTPLSTMLDFLFEYFDLTDVIKSLLTSEILIKLNDHDSFNRKNLVIPGFFGLITKNYKEMAKKLNCLTSGLQFSNASGSSDEHKMYLDDYVNLFKSDVVKYFADCDNFVLIAHSFGVTIALKLAKILEDELKIPGQLIAIDGSPQTERNQSRHLILGENIEDTSKKFYDIMINKVNENKFSWIENEKDLVEDISKRFISNLNYVFTDNKFEMDVLKNTKITLLKGNDDFIKADDEYYGLKKYTTMPIDIYQTKENHVSIILANETYEILRENLGC